VSKKFEIERVVCADYKRCGRGAARVFQGSAGGVIGFEALDVISMSLIEKLEKVTDRDSFLEFVDALIVDRRAMSDTWENQSIDAYLEAASAWARDSSGQENGIGGEATWQTFATFLYCGKIYE
jgi:hypothetical protein